ncbi:MAG TPA: DUF4255 domain-containing protein [Cytophagales bacterium]|nr:DUF4255 domain-containing protein [Cytophagales bacterium]HAP59795.1 DUF4255 domain-containing protein [Cytophagales bacterium]
MLINVALKFLRDELNQYLQKRKPSSTHKVEFTYLTKNDGQGADFKLGMSLVNMEEERKVKDQSFYKESPAGQPIRVHPEVKINLYVLFTVKDEDQYEQALEYLSLIVQFFQANPYFNGQTHPTLDASIQKLIAELYTLSFEQQNNLWGSLSTRYLPSALYKIRLVAVQEVNELDIAPSLDASSINLGAN